jgi:hypothetical protein
VPLKRATKFFEKEQFAECAQLLENQRQAALRAGDDESLAVLDEVCRQLRSQLEGDEIADFDSGLQEGSRVIDVSPVGLVLAGCGAAAMLLAVFLPYAEATSFATIEQNTLIQNGVGWLFVALAVVAAGTLYRAYHSKVRTWGPIITGLIGIGAALYFGSNRGNSLQLCSVSTGTNCEIANPGIGVYVAGIGGLLMVVGGLQIRGSKRKHATSMPTVGVSTEVATSSDTRPTKDCPECAETILAAARVCKHCGYRYPEAASTV